MPKWSSSTIRSLAFVTVDGEKGEVSEGYDLAELVWTSYFGDVAYTLV